jgi:hypothetical protein
MGVQLFWALPSEGMFHTFPIKIHLLTSNPERWHSSTSSQFFFHLHLYLPPICARVK